VSAPPFAYARAASIEEASALLLRPGARALAGGQSLIPLLVQRALRAEVLVDLLAVPGFDEIRRDGDELILGALTRQRAAERSPEVKAACPLLAEGLEHVGHPSTRNRGTIGGSLVHADPAAELPVIAVALDARVTVRGADGAQRTSPIAEFLTGANRVALTGGELLVDVRLPVASVREGQAWTEFAPRFADLPIVGAAALLELGSAGRVIRVRAAIGGVGAVPADVSDRLRGRLRGECADKASLRQAAAEVARELVPTGDRRGSAALRSRLAATLLGRTLCRAWDRASA
jgi:CO/xanthine dehydrogenase FAD-binding subunit